MERCRKWSWHQRLGAALSEWGLMIWVNSKLRWFGGASFRKCNVIGKFNLIKSFSIRLWADSFLRAYKSLTKLHISLYTYFNIVKQLAVSAWLSIHHQKPLTGCDAHSNTPLYLDIICSHFGMMAFGMPVNAALRFSLADDSRKDSPLILCVGWRGTPSRKLHTKKKQRTQYYAHKYVSELTRGTRSWCARC